jgi:hypothetical protein
MKIWNFFAFISVFLFVHLSSAFGLDAAKQKEMERIMHLKLPELNIEAKALLDAKYPNEDWDAYNFPPFVYTSDIIATGYKVAVKRPEILKLTFCYCFCDAMGHTSLLSCFWKDGKVGGSFDNHAASCNVCIGQALQALLVYELGASEEEVDKMMEKRFKKNIEGKKSEEGKKNK